MYDFVNHFAKVSFNQDYLLSIIPWALVLLTCRHRVIYWLINNRMKLDIKYQLAGREASMKYFSSETSNKG